MRGRLDRVMENSPDEYARFRAACALAAHDPGKYREEVIKTLKEAQQDPDVSKIASSYLRRLEK